MNINEFVDMFAKLELNEDCKQYQCYPFHLVVEKPDGGLDVNALCTDTVADCYKRVKQYHYKGFKKMYMSIDFPATGDIDHDFVGIFTIHPDKIGFAALPYDSKTGEKFARIYKSHTITMLLDEFSRFLQL